ncbi:23S rRNA (uracil(1939)-C(5))-methyltransferase RlmD [Muribacter muris]|uniref:23S rRNA (uracil(1939)-C(5))-methyltransferase RlmD n=1 Tax=Muribacter muris TaxID=67855 RepID=A0A4Y9K5Z7_9PAST|nr:23S rRNA (uracil(1939)-C(5))-methyltransferase RlmD [Muribacter muris]MBF0784575.1 23S rRNA (uracil(1939)-C(5))-methyltransferase RlmD [Muribacter muris]MBF0826129.1 23S rRNA (uracil(1939)-C(5))-methyltransferase RlmD [Muribacter muris]TFV12086.1 23S rRNA (uracil(1939)-C(5))-methyltransferase RlmD [Muribacter muris]
MALFYSDKRAKKVAQPTALQRFAVQALDYQGLGVAKLNGKTWFIENALPDEVVDADILEEKRQYGRAQAVRFIQKSAKRQDPHCAVYHQCGGCQMRHIPIELQRDTKQSTLFRRLQTLQAEPIVCEPMLAGNAARYRRRAKFSVMWEKGQFVIGFRQAGSHAIIPLQDCDVLEPALAALLPPLQQLFAAWQQKKAVGHIELVRADNGVAILLRHIGALKEADRTHLLAFAERYRLMLFVMTDKDQLEQWYGEPPFYTINSLKLGFSIRDFIQINADLNEKMVAKAQEWLALTPQDRVLDLFCGMGNFTLPLARSAAHIVGVEGVEAMVEQARENAQRNGIGNAAFYQTDLDQPFIDQPWAAQPFNKVLLDPARQGAYFALAHLCRLAPERIVYVSCNPATLVRDSEKLIQHGYRLAKCAMIDMFPHTAHLESISLFVKK